MNFEEVNVLLNAYEFYRYESVSQKTMQQIMSHEKQKSDKLQMPNSDANNQAPKSRLDLIEPK